MKKNDRKMKRRNNLFFILMKNNIWRGVIGLILLLISIALLVILVVVHFENIPEFRLENYRETLQNEQFDQISVNHLIKDNGSIEIVNDRYEVVFPEGTVKQYTEEEIVNITPIGLKGETLKPSYYISEGQPLTLYSVSTEMMDSCYLLIDEDLNYVDSKNFSFIKDTYTIEDLDYIEKDYLKETLQFKYSFTSNEYKHYTLLYIYDEVEVTPLFGVERALATGFVFSLLLYLVFIIWSVRSLSKKIKKPLDVLEEAMTEFTEGNYDNILEYKAVNEISRIIDTFNVMVEKLNSSKEANRKLVEDRERLIANIAHDLKTPITITRGYSKALMDDKISSDELNEYYEKIYNKTSELNELVNVFANYSKLNHPDFKLDSTLVDVNEYIRNYLASNYSFVIGNGFQMEMEISDEELYTELDELHFKRALDNILSNFVKYNEEGTTFRVEVESRGDSCRIYLENNGELIEKGLARNLFKPFTMGDQSRTASNSSGLGLATVQRIVELHNGVVEYKQSDSKNIFVITLPLM